MPITVLAFALLALPPLALAQPGARTDLAAAVRAAEALATKGEHAAAASAYGAAVAATHAAGDPLAELDAARSLEAFLGRRAGTESPAAELDALARVLGELDPTRGGAFVSAHAVAETLLAAAVESGDRTHAAGAALALGRRAKAKYAGAGVLALERLAAGVAAEAAGRSKDADAALTRSLELAAAEEWRDLATLAATELAALRAAAGDVDGAAGALAAAARLFDAGADPDLAVRFDGLVRARLAGAGAAVLGPYREALEPLLSQGQSAGAAGGAGGAPADRSAETPLSRALRTLGKRAPLATAERTAAGFELALEFEPKAHRLAKPAHGLVHHSLSGVVLAVHGSAVMLVDLDPSGARGAPGDSSSPGRRLAGDRLARGETWTLARDGSVSIRK